MPGPTPMSRRTLIAGSLAGAAAISAGGELSAAKPAEAATGQPYAFYWYPDSLPTGDIEPAPGAVWRSLLDWDPDADEDLIFNTASVPLAERETVRPSHPGQHPDETRVQSLVSFAPTASNPSQGGPDAAYYAFTQWAYVDELIFWGGSSGEGIILAPNAPVVDAAHRAGVRVLGNVFLPPQAYGGLPKWTTELIQQAPDGSFPVADKLIMVADRLGFDGWFINPETQPAEADKAEVAAGFQEFLRYLQLQSEQRIVYYDALTEDGDVDWQNALTDRNDGFLQNGRHRVSDEMFLNFWWESAEVAATAETAEAIGRSRYDAFFGIDTEADGIDTDARWDLVFDPNAEQPYGGSLGLYRPEWTKNSLGDTFTLGDFQQRDHQYWVGSGTEPRPRSQNTDWPGIAAYVPERTTVIELPFTSAFGTGAGESYAVDGKIISTSEWNNLSVQDIQPQRRWVLHGADLGPRYDYGDAFQAGESLLFDVAAEEGSCELFQLAGPIIEWHTEVELWVKGDADVAVDVTTTRGRSTLPTRPTGTRNGWRRLTTWLTRCTGERLTVVGIRLSGGAGTFRLGQLSIGARNRRRPEPVTELAARHSGDGVRASWTKPDGVHHLEVYADGEFATATAGLGCYLPASARRVQVVTVAADYQRSGQVSTRVR